MALESYTCYLFPEPANANVEAAKVHVFSGPAKVEGTHLALQLHTRVTCIHCYSMPDVPITAISRENPDGLSMNMS